MTENFYLPFRQNGTRVWCKLNSLLPKGTLDSSNTRIYLGQLNWPNGSGSGAEVLILDDYMITNHGLPPQKIKLPKDYRKRAYALHDNEIAASLVSDEISDLVDLAGRLAEQHPHSLSYLAGLDEQKRELTLYPTVLSFYKIRA